MSAGTGSLAALAFNSDTPLAAFPVEPDSTGRMTRRRRHFLAGRWCARQALAHAGYAEHCPLHGDADGVPQWPAQWLGSISHTDGRAVAVVARHTDLAVLGVDVERVMSPQRADRLQARIATAGELARVSDFSTGAAVALLFSAKEALYKALYPRVRHFEGFDAAVLRARHGRLLTFELTRDWSAGWRRGQRIEVRFRVGPQYVHSLAWLPRPGHVQFAPVS